MKKVEDTDSPTMAIPNSFHKKSTQNKTGKL